MYSAIDVHLFSHKVCVYECDGGQTCRSALRILIEFVDLGAPGLIEFCMDSSCYHAACTFRDFKVPGLSYFGFNIKIYFLLEHKFYY